jgi:hypothetical protein
MSFSDDEQIVIEKKSKIKTAVLMVSIGLFAFSLFNIAFYTEDGFRTSIEALFMGWLAMLTGGAAMTWMANPFLIVTWIFLGNNKKSAWIFGLISSLISILFLKFHVIIENEAGHYNAILKVGLGFWLWLSSCVTAFVGCLILLIKKHLDLKRMKNL